MKEEITIKTKHLVITLLIVLLGVLLTIGHIRLVNQSYNKGVTDTEKLYISELVSSYHSCIPVTLHQGNASAQFIAVDCLNQNARQ